MSVDPIASIVRILKPDGTTAGTGFVVSDEGLVATCAHVVEAAGAGAGDAVRLVLHATGDERKASVERDWWRPADAEDVAILRLEGNLPERVKPPLLGSTGGTSGHRFKTFGFPGARPVDGMWGYGTLGDPTTEKDHTILQLTGATEVTLGFSGAPVMDTITCRVVGMITTITVPDRYGRMTATAFITPSETLQKACRVLEISDLCPYRGLDPFTKDDVQYFFGRQRAEDRIVDSLKGGADFLAVLGPSGGGKSSLVQAGLIPQLQKGAVPGSDRWGAIVTRPVDLPRLEAEELAGASQDLVGAVRGWLDRHPEHSHLLLVVDQFEELLVPGLEASSAAFLSELVALLESSLPVKVLLVMRDDFLGRFSQEAKGLAARLGQNLVYVPPTLTRAELGAIVEQPAQAVGLKFESGLVEAILTDTVRSASDGQQQAVHSTILPLLELALTQLWERRQDGVLTHAAYQAIGRVTGGLAQWASQVYSRLDKRQQPLAQRILTDLVHLGDESQGLPDSRRRRPLAALSRHESERDAAHQIVQQLAGPRARLLVTGHDPRSKQETVELIHDALLHEWGLLKEWLDKDRPFLIWRQALEGRVRTWVASGPNDPSQRDKDELLQRRPLDDALVWLEKRENDLSAEERAFIRASLARRERDRARNNLLLAAGLLLALLLTAAAGVGWWSSVTNERALKTAVVVAELAGTAEAKARQEAEVAATAEAKARQNAEEQRRIALARQLVAQSQAALLEVYPQRSLLLAVEALSVTLRMDEPRVPAAEDALRQALANSGGRGLAGHDGPVFAVAISSDTNWLVTGSADTTARLWDLTAADPTAAPVVLSGHDDSISAVAISPDNRWLATGSLDYTVRLWDLTVPDPAAEPILLQRHHHPITAMAISPDNRWLVTAEGPLYMDGALHLGHFDQGWVVCLWDLTAADPAAEPILLRDHESGVSAIAIDPDSHWLVTGAGMGGDHTVRLWDLTAADPAAGPAVLRGHDGDITAVGISRDNHWLVTGSEDATARLWDLTAGDPAAGSILLRGHESSINAIAISSNSRWLTTGSADGATRLWDLTAGDPAADPILLGGHESTINAVAISPDNRWLVTGNGDGAARLWDLTAPDPAAETILLRGHESGINAVAISPDNRWLVTGSYDDAARLWNLSALLEAGSTAADLAAAPIVLRGHGGTIRAAAISSDNHWLVTGSAETTARLWDLTAADPAAESIVLRGHESGVYAVAISPDNRWLATGSGDSTARLWDLTAADPAAESIVLRGHESGIYAIAISPDNHWLVTGGEFDDHTARLWDLTATDPAAGSILLPGHESAIHAVAVSPDGRWLVTGSEDNTARLWDLTAVDPAAEPIVLHSDDDPITAVAISPDGHWLAACSDLDATVRLWDLTDPTAEPIVLRGCDYVVAISPNNQWLVIGSWDYAARLWDLTDLTAAPIVLRGHENRIFAMAVSSDNRWLVTGSGDNTARVWDLTDLTAAPVILRGHEDAIRATAISPDNRWLVTGSEDGTARLWHLRLDELIDLACRTAGRNLTGEEWQRFMKHEEYRPTCPDLPLPEE